MIRNFPDFPLPVAELWPSESFMSIDEIERFAPAIDSELTAEEIAGLTLESARQIVGGVKALCHRDRLRNEEMGLVAVNTPRERGGDHES